MRNSIFLLAAGLIFSGTAYSLNYNRAINLSEDLRAELTDLAQEARAEARAANRPARKDKLRAVARQSRELKQALNQNLIPALDNEAREGRVKRIFENRIKPEFQDIRAAINNMRRVPAGVSDEFSDVAAKFQRLKRVINRGGQNGGGRFKGQCKVVLETFWGHDIKDFYGYANARSRDLAATLAKEEAIEKCEAAGGNDGILKCNVANSQCYATRN